MFTKILTTLLLLITFIVAGLCLPNPEQDNYIIVEHSDGTVHNISLLDTLEDDKHFDWSQPVDYNTENFSLNKTLDHVFPHLYINEDPDTPYPLTPITALHAPIKVHLPTVVIIHGWLEKGDKFWLLRMKDKYLLNGKYNVIAVNWHDYALKPYWISALYTRKVGQYVGDILVSLIDGGVLNAKDIHIVGHSLGAHVAGYLGKSVKTRTKKGEKIGRITGLDPAGPLFELPIIVPSSKRLVKEDATFVDVIHTCSGLLGVKRSIGHIDFWPNSGFPPMSGCKLATWIMCSHARSYEYYTESINTKNFGSYSCKTWLEYEIGFCDENDKQPMGFYVDTSANGDYYLKTNGDKPYARG